MTVNHGVPGSSPGEGAQRKPLKSSVLKAFLFSNGSLNKSIIEDFEPKKTIYLQKFCTFYREELTLKNGKIYLRPKEGI